MTAAVSLICFALAAVLGAILILLSLYRQQRRRHERGEDLEAQRRLIRQRLANLYAEEERKEGFR